jgi:hypothetical protein
MFKIVHTGAGRDDVRVESSSPLTPEDFRNIARDLVRPVVRARKIGFVKARPARNGEVVETRWNGKETTNCARKGDWVVVNLLPSRKPLRDREGYENTYVIAGNRFNDLYEPVENGNAEIGKGSEATGIYRAKGSVLALRLPGGFDIAAPWGERQRAPTGYLILNGQEVYGNNAETFRETYQVV